MATITISVLRFQTLNNSHFNSTPSYPNKPNLNTPLKYFPKCPLLLSHPLTRPLFSGNCFLDGGSDNTVKILEVPHHWFEPSNALQESKWLRVALHKWLDDEYCPEETNVDISRVAAESYYQSLVQKTADLGEILLRMVTELGSLSYQESFHGPFSAANAAVSLITQRMEQD